jgi:hypothetical protein
LPNCQITKHLPLLITFTREKETPNPSLVSANALEWERAQEVREPELVSHYKTAFERVKDIANDSELNVCK